jgi:SAM-dependent methyltransferase
MENVYVDLYAVKRSGQIGPKSKFALLSEVVSSYFSAVYTRLGGGYGAGFHLFIFRKALQAFLNRKLTFMEFYYLACLPMDSFRYFEFHQAFEYIRKVKANAYLDISSPRFFPAFVLSHKQVDHAVLLNPDVKDLDQTRDLFPRLGLQKKGDIRYDGNLIDDLAAPDESFDLISAISVFEHIPEESIRPSIRKVFDLLRPGGFFVVSIPVSPRPFNEYINWNEYGLQKEEKRSEESYFFGQRFHDQALIEQYFCSVFGDPVRKDIIGEKEAGYFFANRLQKINDPAYPYHWEALDFFRNYRPFNAIPELTGIGVIALLFQKRQ